MVLDGAAEKVIANEVEIVEALAITNGVELAVDNRWEKAILETDSLIVFSETKKKDFERRWKLKPILKRFDILKDQLHKFLIQRIRKDANKAADKSLVFILNKDGLPTPSVA
ncbi:hypothetical protein J1N35_008456 [Gossypium stocksii]|uniref:RNase H type-1 domain-containing protein n=1 Tax=Gossypium stocksii TaxID=47602 RepID=A0A9D4AGH1_9ROSI|nr:hypothetical protein J1N35_008456 [Gossypium stocksii]